MIGSRATESDASQDAAAPFSTIKATAEYLASRLAHVDPASLVHSSTCPKLTLHQQTISGGKIWRAFAFEKGLNIQWGKCGTRGQQKFIPLEQCTGNSSVLEMQKRTVAKLREGYVILLHESKLP